jgi:hypothetical protein
MMMITVWAAGGNAMMVRLMHKDETHDVDHQTAYRHCTPNSSTLSATGNVICRAHMSHESARY